MSSILIWFISRFIYMFAKLLHMSYRYRYSGTQNIEFLKSQNKNAYILGTWHQNLLPGILNQTLNRYVCIVSRSKDAAPVVYTLKKMNHFVRRGSSKKGNRDKGGKQAKEQLIDILKLGIPAAVTIDGPKGPAQEVKPGIIDMAKKSGTPIVPYTTIADSNWTFNSWDKFRLPKPFSKIIVHYGEPLFVPSDAEGEDFEQLAKQLKERLVHDEKLIGELRDKWNDLTPHNVPLTQPTLTVEQII
jgi:lysophospholipid acyltransferase (LPLAT)-like uncharacterized protein